MLHLTLQHLHITTHLPLWCCLLSYYACIYVPHSHGLSIHSDGRSSVIGKQLLSPLHHTYSPFSSFLLCLILAYLVTLQCALIRRSETFASLMT